MHTPRKTLRAFLALAALSMCLSLIGHRAQANNPVTSGDKSTKQVVSTHWYSASAPASATVFSCFKEADGTTDALIPWNATVVASCDARAVLCWLQDGAAITMDTATGVLTDASAVPGNGTDGLGACFSVQAGLQRPMRNGRSPFTSPSAVGRRSGACVDGSANATGRPCDADADCTGADTCDLTADRFPWTAGTYLCAVVPSGSAASCDVNIEED